MTREENIRAILECNFAGFREDIIDVAVKSICELEEEPCEDFISRKDVKELFEEGDVIGIYHFLGIDDLPSIAPKESQANVLDKIKEEIENLANLDPSDWNHINAEKCEVVVAIIDKYREGEDDSMD